jgi:VCBS repeat-containing protein
LSVANIDTTSTIGVVTNNGDGTFDYDPNGQFEHLAVGETATDTFTYTVIDEGRITDVATVTITVTGVNDVPTANDDFGDGFRTDEDTAFVANVLANDTDADTSDALFIQSIDTTGTVGLVTDNGDGTLSYDPNSQFDHLAVGTTTTDTFEYTVSDGNGGTDTATVTITITGVNDPPVANDDGGEGFTTNEDTAFTTFNVLANDSDVDGGEVFPTLYYSSRDQNGVIKKVTGDSVEVIQTDPVRPANFGGLAVDSENGHLYSGDGAHLFRTDLNGENRVDLVSVAFDPIAQLGVTDIELDLRNNRIYWVNNGLRIWRANLDGSDAEELLAFPHSGPVFIYGLALDSA